MYILCTLSGRLAVHRQSVLLVCHNRYLGQSDEDVYLISGILSEEQRDYYKTVCYTPVNIRTY